MSTEKARPKIWFETYQNLTLGNSETVPVLFGLTYNRHYCGNPKLFKQWRGFSAYLHFLKWTFSLHAVDNYRAYDIRMNYYRYRKGNKLELPIE